MKRTKFYTTGPSTNALRAILLPLIVVSIILSESKAQDQFVTYFSGTTAGVGNLGGTTFDADGNFWVIAQIAPAGPFPVPRLNKIEFENGVWNRVPHVTDQDMTFFYRSSDLANGVTNPFWGGPLFGTPSSFLLNPAPLTLQIPTGSGGTQTVTYQPGELAFISDAMRELSEEDGTDRSDHTKKIWRYDLRKVDNPDASISGPTTAEPDFDTAMNGDGTDPGDQRFGAFGLADWNDVFAQVVSEADIRAAAGNVGGSDNFGRSFAWSSDGQSIYAVDAGSNTGGIYKIDATQTGVVQRIWVDNTSDENGTRIISEPAVVHTSVFDFDPSNPGVGDQIIVEGSSDGGNEGGLNVYLDTGTGNVSPQPILTKEQFRDFAEYVGDSEPSFLSITNDDQGNLYFYEIRTDGLFRLDTQGRLAKVASEAEHNEYQNAAGLGPNDNFLDLQVRTSNANGFEVNEIIFQDDAFDAPIGLYDFKTGDFDRDNDTDQADLALFAAAIGTRGEPAEIAEFKFDLNGNPEWRFDVEDNRFEHVSGGAAVVDWKDIKILQQFVSILDGDTNFDGALDLMDLDIVEANYFTDPSQTSETWLDGDFGSIESSYPIDAVDANLVNEVDLVIFADSWTTLGQAAPSRTELEQRGYDSSFIDDLLAAFGDSGLQGDYNGDGRVDLADYTIWRNTLGNSGSNLPADGSGNEMIDEADYTVWRDNFGTFNPVTGDYNQDGVVNLADYTVWRNTLGATGMDLAADGNNDQIVDSQDYFVWKSGFGGPGTTASLQTNTVVPEPSAHILLVGISLLLTVHWRFRSYPFNGC